MITGVGVRLSTGFGSDQMTSWAGGRTMSRDTNKRGHWLCQMPSQSRSEHVPTLGGLPLRKPQLLRVTTHLTVSLANLVRHYSEHDGYRAET